MQMQWESAGGTATSKGCLAFVDLRVNGFFLYLLFTFRFLGIVSKKKSFVRISFPELSNRKKTQIIIGYL